MKKNKVVEKELTVDDIVPFWSIREGWDDLTYEQKCEYYWRYEHGDKGVRIFPTEGGKDD